MSAAASEPSPRTPTAAIAVIPWSDPFEVAGYTVTGWGADLNIGVLFLFALSGLGFYGLILGGWASGNKYSLLGAARTAAQLVSYEVAMGLSVIGVIMMAESLSLVDIVHAQQDSVWYVLLQPIGFLVFLTAAVLNFFIPSGGGQWAVQGPIALEAGLRLGVDPGVMVMSVAYGDQITNMLQPFWALPLLAVTGVKARDIVGYTAILMVAGGVWVCGVLLLM